MNYRILQNKVVIYYKTYWRNKSHKQKKRENKRTKGEEKMA